MNAGPGHRHPYRQLAYDTRRNRIWLHSGVCQGHTPTLPFPQIGDPDTLYYDSITHTWTAVSTSPSSATGTRIDSAMVYDSNRDKIIMFGGLKNQSYNNETWEFNPANNSWSQLTTTCVGAHCFDSRNPQLIAENAMVYDAVNDKVIVFGGIGPFVCATGCNWTWEYNPATRTWTEQTPSQAPSPSKHPAMAYDSRRGIVWVYDESTHLTWSYNAATHQWRQELAVAAGPETRYAPQQEMAYDANTDKLILLFERSNFMTGISELPLSSVDMETGPAAMLLMVSGNSQTGAVAQTLSGSFVVRVTDANANPVAGVAVAFAVTAGGGTVSPGLAFTDLSGLTSTTLTLGPQPGVNTITVTSADMIGSPIIFTATALLLGQTPSVSPGGVVNNASYILGSTMVAPGSIAAVFGSNLNDGSTVLSTSFGLDGKVVTTLGGASATINNIPVPMLYSTPIQIGVQIPFELAGQISATILVTVGDHTSEPSTIFLDEFGPGVFTLSQDGLGAAVVLHQDEVTPVTESNPAHPTEFVVLYGTGLGALDPPLETGVASTINRTASTVTVTIDGIPAEVPFAGAAPGFVGLNQLNVKIPASTRIASNIPLVVSVGGRQSNPVTIPVGP